MVILEAAAGEVALMLEKEREGEGMVEEDMEEVRAVGRVVMVEKERGRLRA
jgi:hypothetical protein